MFENKIFHGRHVSIYIWSWINAGGKFDDVKWDYEANAFKGMFVEWLRGLIMYGERLTEEEINYIIGYRHDAHSGRVELENLAYEFLQF